MKSISRLPASALFASIAALSLVACADEETDELAGESTADDAGETDGKADASDGVYTFYSVRKDYRRCASPWCGGEFLTRVNRGATICHDGASQAECYVPQIDFSSSGLSAADLDQIGGRPYLVRGRFANRTFSGIGNLGTFKVSEVWTSLSDEAGAGVFVRIKDSNARCISDPCLNKTERALNRTAQASISDIRWEDAELSDEALNSAIESSFREGVIAVGYRYYPSYGGRRGKGRTASAVYQKIKPGSAAQCFVGGCSGQVCSDRPDVITTCEFRPEYACYREAECARQPSGQCGWTPTESLNSCLANPPQL